MISQARNVFDQAERAVRALGALRPAAQRAALGLFVLNAVAVISLMDVADAALQLHVFWGSLLLGLVLWGPGRIAVDSWWLAARARRLA